MAQCGSGRPNLGPSRISLPLHPGYQFQPRSLAPRSIAMATAVSPSAPTHVPQLPAIEGVRLATAAAGIRYPGRTDVMLALLAPGTTVAGVFTRSKCPSAPVEWCRSRLKP